ncbi:twin-arginine translocation signal domain-containing protein, partial [Microbacterium sp. C23T]
MGENMPDHASDHDLGTTAANPPHSGLSRRNFLVGVSAAGGLAAAGWGQAPPAPAAPGGGGPPALSRGPCVGSCPTRRRRRGSPFPSRTARRATRSRRRSPSRSTP